VIGFMVSDLTGDAATGFRSARGVFFVNRLVFKVIDFRFCITGLAVKNFG